MKALGLNEGLVEIKLERALELAFVKLWMVEDRVAWILAPVADALERAQRGRQLLVTDEQIDIPHAARPRARIDELRQGSPLEHDDLNWRQRIERAAEGRGTPNGLGDAGGMSGRHLSQTWRGTWDSETR